MGVLLTDQFRIFFSEKFIKALEGPDAGQSDSAAGANRDRLYLLYRQTLNHGTMKTAPTGS